MTDALNLSSRQRRIYYAVRSHQVATSLPVTMRELEREAEISSTSVVSYNVRKLVGKGLLEYDHEITRSIRIAGSRYEIPDVAI